MRLCSGGVRMRFAALFAGALIGRVVYEALKYAVVQIAARVSVVRNAQHLKK